MPISIAVVKTAARATELRRWRRLGVFMVSVLACGLSMGAL
jgi:hypothetical protein